MFSQLVFFSDAPDVATVPYGTWLMLPWAVAKPVMQASANPSNPNNYVFINKYGVNTLGAK